MKFINRVRSPELPQNYPWLNSDRPLSLKELRGRAVILDFWTYCCINCLHVLPDLKYLEQKYKDSLTVIGVHSAKFDGEKEVENIRQAILRYDIEHPVLVDSDFKVWQQYAVRAWPTLAVIDPQGYYLGSVSGEGHRDALDEFISQLIEPLRASSAIAFQELSFKLEKYQKPLTAPLAFPGKVLADETSDRLFVADSGHHRLVVSTLDGKVLHVIGTGKPGLTDGSFEEAQFFAPQGMALDADTQILYLADTENHALRRIDVKNQTVETIAGTGEQSHNIRPHGGRGLQIALNSPWDVEKIGDRLYIAMAGCHQIWEMQLDTGIVQTHAGTGAEAGFDGLTAEAAFAQPSGIATDGRELFVADSEISSIRAVGLGSPHLCRGEAFEPIIPQSKPRIDNPNASPSPLQNQDAPVGLNTMPQVRTVCGSGELFGFGDKDGSGLEVRLQHCLGVEYARNYLWVADTYNHKIKRVDTRSGVCETIVGDGTAGWQDGQGTNPRFFEPSGLSAAGSYLYVADTNNHAIRRVELDGMKVTTLQFSGLCSPDVCREYTTFVGAKHSGE